MSEEERTYWSLVRIGTLATVAQPSHPHQYDKDMFAIYDKFMRRMAMQIGRDGRTEWPPHQDGLGISSPLPGKGL